MSGQPGVGGGLPPGISLDPLARTPTGYRLIDVERIVGRGRASLDRLAAALLDWEVHRRAGLRVGTASAAGPCRVTGSGSGSAGPVQPGPARPGTRVTLAPTTGPAALLRLSAPCEVVAVVNGTDEHGFAYATLPGHPESGEQSFVVWLDGPDDEVVHARVRSFSRPGSLLTRLAAPVARREQDRIVGRYLDAMRDLAR